jgi:ribosome maturation factor RimP
MLNITEAQKESIIEEILYSNGYELSEIQFRNDNGKKWVRIGYWQRLSASEQAQLDTLLEEDCIAADDDTLDAFFYWIK